MSSRTGSRLASAFLGYLLGVVVLVTLVPFDFSAAAPHNLLWGGALSDALANVAMFVPLGFLFRLTREPRGDRWGIQPLFLGLLLSALIETAQLFLPSRLSSPLDVATNGLGAWLGAIAADALVRRLRPAPALVGALALELPLIGLVYLLVPLLWLSGLTAADEPARMSLSLLLGLMGAIILGAVYRNRFAPEGNVSVAQFSVLAAAWYLIGAVPGLVEHPLLALASGLLVAGATGIWSRRWAHEQQRADRRFEGETLTWLAPVLGLYLVCLAGWPPWAPMVAWHGEWGLRGFWGSADTTAILRALEQLAAFTVVGYAVAEYHGRRELRFSQSGALVAICALGGSAVVKVVAALHPGAGASALRGLLSMVVAGYGGGIYHLQRAHIRSLLGAKGAPRPAEAPTRGTATSPRLAQNARIEAPMSAGRRG
ncbi:MAG: VanZ family protein [Gemmatimonadota bacterium]